VINEVSITIVSGVVVGCISIVVIIGAVSVIGGTIVLSVSCLWFGCILIRGSVGGMVGFVAGGVAWDSVCSVCAAVVIALVVCCCSFVAAERFVGCSDIGDRV